MVGGAATVPCQSRCLGTSGRSLIRPSYAQLSEPLKMNMPGPAVTWLLVHSVDTAAPITMKLLR